MVFNFDDISFQILTIDRFHHKEGVFDVKGRPYSSLSFRVSGEGSFEIMNKRFLSQPGDVLFIPAHEPYKVQYSVGESIVVHLRDCNYCEAENINIENQSAIELRFQHLLEAWNTRHSFNQAKSEIYDIFDVIAGDKKVLVFDTAFAKCLEYIDANFCDSDMNIEKVCRLGFISASSLQRAFIKHIGLSPKQYLMKLRMNKALELLSEGVHSIKEISAMCGIEDEKYFSRAFKQKYGYPPSHYL